MIYVTVFPVYNAAMIHSLSGFDSVPISLDKTSACPTTEDDVYTISKSFESKGRGHSCIKFAVYRKISFLIEKLTVVCDLSKV